MELSQIMRRLWAAKVVFAVVVLLAILAAVKVGSRRTGPPTGAATAQILVDSPQSALASLKQNTLPLSTRAGVFAQFMASSVVRDAIAKASGIPSDKILAQGPFDDPAASSTAASAPKPPDTASLKRGKPYRLLFVSQQDLPLITVYAQAPTPAAAAKLANAVGKGVQDYVDGLQAKDSLDPLHRVVIRTLGPAEAGTVSPSANLPMMAAAFLGVLVLGSLGILTLMALGRAVNRRRAGSEYAEPSDPEFDDGLADEAGVPTFQVIEPDYSPS